MGLFSKKKVEEPKVEEPTQVAVDPMVETNKMIVSVKALLEASHAEKLNELEDAETTLASLVKLVEEQQAVVNSITADLTKMSDTLCTLEILGKTTAPVAVVEESAE